MSGAPAIRGSGLSLAARYLKEKGGRGYDNGLTVTIFGATGFLGGYVASHLGNMGSTLVVPYRGDDHEVRHLRVMADLGQFAPIPFSVRDRNTVREAVKGSDIVINLIGKHYATKHLLPWWINYSLEDSNVEAARTIAEVCREEGVERLIHHSSILADENSPSEWAASKGRGEKAVREAFPGANIVRSSILYGREDRFLVWIANQMKLFNIIPVIEGGNTRLQPVYVNDVAEAIVSIVCDKDIHGKTFELVGKDEYTYKEIAEVVMDVSKRTPHLLNVPLPVAKMFGKIAEKFPEPKFSSDLATLLTMDQVKTSNLPGLYELDVEPSNLEKEAFNCLHRFRRGGHFQSVAGYH